MKEKFLKILPVARLIMDWLIFGTIVFQVWNKWDNQVVMIYILIMLLWLPKLSWKKEE